MAKKISKGEYFEHLENTLGQEASSIQPDVEHTVFSTEATAPKSDLLEIVKAARLEADAAIEKLVGMRVDGTISTAYGKDISSLRPTPGYTTKLSAHYHTDDLLGELGHHLKNINTKIDTLINEKSDLLTVLKDIGMHLTILYNRDIETPCIAFEGINVHIKLTIEQYAKLVSLGVPVV
jgi:hypothetical protein